MSCAVPWVLGYYHFEAHWLTEGLGFVHRAVALGAFPLRAFPVPFSLMRLPFKVCAHLVAGRANGEGGFARSYTSNSWDPAVSG